MRTPFKTLTIGLVLATAAMAGCSSTTGSSGAVQNAATASASAAASSAASTGPTSSAEPVTPTDAPTEPSASPTASPTNSTSSSESPQSGGYVGAATPVDNDVCDPGLRYPCGSIGASGVGTVFYASLTAFACGANMASTCNYLESAPNLWNPDSKISCKAATGTSCGGSVQETSDFSSTGLGFPWCTGSGETERVNGAIGKGIGAGFANTTAMLPVCNPGDAGNVARSYTGGELTDWSLASKDELNALNFYKNRAAIGGFNSGWYWSSSEGDSERSWQQEFKIPGSIFGGVKYEAVGVRPIRAF